VSSKIRRVLSCGRDCTPYCRWHHRHVDRDPPDPARVRRLELAGGWHRHARRPAPSPSCQHCRDAATFDITPVHLVTTRGGSGAGTVGARRGHITCPRELYQHGPYRQPVSRSLRRPTGAPPPLAVHGLDGRAPVNACTVNRACSTRSTVPTIIRRPARYQSLRVTNFGSGQRHGHVYTAGITFWQPTARRHTLRGPLDVSDRDRLW